MRRAALLDRLARLRLLWLAEDERVAGDARVRAEFRQALDVIATAAAALAAT